MSVVAFVIALLVGLILCVVGAVASFMAASVNMSWRNSLPRAGCAFLVWGGILLAIGIWGLRA